ncbi:MAG: cytochrome c [Gammaproteobacteria bacterium]|jgi:mono/diheme cytochrome c family protein
MRMLVGSVSVLAGVGLSTVLAQTASVPLLRDGAFSEAQALRGQELYYSLCLDCHGDDMSGRDQSPPLAGPQFSGVWSGASLWSLTERIGTMPPDRPDMLSRAEAVDLLSYMLWFNGLPLGESELGADKGMLENVAFEIPEP